MSSCDASQSRVLNAQGRDIACKLLSNSVGNIRVVEDKCSTRLENLLLATLLGPRTSINNTLGSKKFRSNYGGDVVNYLIEGNVKMVEKVEVVHYHSYTGVLNLLCRL